jgi:hypothetical protein
MNLGSSLQICRCCFLLIILERDLILTKHQHYYQVCTVE